MAQSVGVKKAPVLAVRLGLKGGPLRRRLAKAAKQEGVTLSEFVRRAAIKAADATLQSADPKPEVSQNDTAAEVAA